ncbi:MAG: DNA repair protein RadA [Actinobacteria bacterium]|uniref:Unannotated protein n=1 Tax=freshwater metagenome TaxID=449393 RepID=A0A6J6WQK8_9ZZZZ|nr:DNA repair protein RadA [Actinomycetota bacterium]MSY26937.1 DNA repair protein RadA [Actinomycetota bacterium]MSZ87523.1 DNA repair protein RadA [Actinomycetota bacterium]MTB13577.1 DNA repair protein RadA [Actinomycetota bacterium]
MAKPDLYRCTECGWSGVKWLGQCPECQAWGSVDEVGGVTKASLQPGRIITPAKPIAEIDVASAIARSSGVPELDRVLGGGIVPGAAILLAGEPGVGKSTLLLAVSAESAKANMKVLYVTGEESASQVRLRAERLKALHPNLFLAAESDLGVLLAHVDQVKPDLLIVDSVQTISTQSVDGSPGGVTQVREVAGALIRVAKERALATILVGHVTKDGSIAGPRLLEHLVDVVLNFEGEKHTRLRLVRAIKNRFGATDEVGCFDLNENGIEGLADPTGLFLSRHSEPVPGTCITVAMEGRRPLLAEIQALVGGASNNTNPRRTTSGLDNARAMMTLAVLELRAGIPLAGRDTYLATVGGMKLTEPAADLALALAVGSAAKGLALPSDLIALGEVGLAGEVRKVNGIQQRLNEAARLGFTRAIVPDLKGELKIPGMEILEVTRLTTALERVRLT